MIKKIIKVALVILAVSTVISFFIDDDEISENATTRQISKTETTLKNDLAVSDFKLNSDISKAVKMLKSKGWKPGDGENGEMLSEYSAYLSAFGYEKPRGNFEGYNVSFVQIAADEYDKLAHYRIIINTAIDIDEIKKIATEKGTEEAKKSIDEKQNTFFRDIQKKCLTQYGYSTCEEESEKGRNSYTYGFKNKNGDICKMEVRITDSIPVYAGENYTIGTTFALDYVSARYRKEEKLANSLLKASTRNRVNNDNGKRQSKLCSVRLYKQACVLL